NGGGPTFIECKTMRMHGHSEHDSARYMAASIDTVRVLKVIGVLQEPQPLLNSAGMPHRLNRGNGSP
ncbi:MAG: hypothetical protein DYH02_11355, partial [Candidatus Omnitrophica bacterium COP1]|nr:hypothetical protein [Candidatus Omnitrophica bacterium COP1]